MEAKQEDLLLPREAARMLRICTWTLANWERRGFLVPVRLPTGHRRYRREEVEALLIGKHPGGNSLEGKYEKNKNRLDEVGRKPGV